MKQQRRRSELLSVHLGSPIIMPMMYFGMARLHGQQILRQKTGRLSQPTLKMKQAFSNLQLKMYVNGKCNLKKRMP